MSSRAGFTVDAARENLRSGRLARAARTREQVRVGELSGFDRVCERADDGILPHKIGKRFGAPGSIEGHAYQILGGRLGGPA